LNIKISKHQNQLNRNSSNTTDDYRT